MRCWFCEVGGTGNGRRRGGEAPTDEVVTAEREGDRAGASGTAGGSTAGGGKETARVVAGAGSDTGAGGGAGCSVGAVGAGTRPVLDGGGGTGRFLGGKGPVDPVPEATERNDALLAARSSGPLGSAGGGGGGALRIETGRRSCVCAVAVAAPQPIEGAVVLNAGAGERSPETGRARGGGGGGGCLARGGVGGGELLDAGTSELVDRCGSGLIGAVVEAPDAPAGSEEGPASGDLAP